MLSSVTPLFAAALLFVVFTGSGCQVGSNPPQETSLESKSSGGGCGKSFDETTKKRLRQASREVFSGARDSFQVCHDDPQWTTEYGDSLTLDDIDAFDLYPDKVQNVTQKMECVFEFVINASDLTSPSFVQSLLAKLENLNRGVVALYPSDGEPAHPCLQHLDSGRWVSDAFRTLGSVWGEVAIEGSSKESIVAWMEAIAQSVEGLAS